MTEPILTFLAVILYLFAGISIFRENYFLISKMAKNRKHVEFIGGLIITFFWFPILLYFFLADRVKGRDEHED